MSNQTWLTEWRHRRRLKKLWIDPRDLDDSLRWRDRHHAADAMPGRFEFKQEAHRFRTAMWITGNREAPKLEGNLWRIERELAAKRRKEALSKHRGLTVVQ